MGDPAQRLIAALDEYPVGNTPLLELTQVAPLPDGVRLYAKAEFMNPTGSVKDRAAVSMIRHGLTSGALAPGLAITEATSGNTGIALAAIGARLGLGVRLYMPANASPERRAILTAHGASLIDTDPLEGSDGAYLAVTEAVRRHPERFFFPDQYNNPANPGAHEVGTGREIWEKTGGAVTHFVAVTGSGGTFVGTSRRLKACNPRVKTIAVQPSSPFHGIEGARHTGSTLHQAITDSLTADEIIEVTTQQARDMAVTLARREGLFVGVSSGANVAAAVALAARLAGPAVIVTVLCDSGSRYLSDSFWKEDSHAGTTPLP